VDFFCEDRHLVVEIDGGQHGPETDRRRTAYLEARGLTVLRFWNSDALRNLEGVAQTILERLDAHGR
jgi:very-short-patch-repair endonuclease